MLTDILFFIISQIINGILFIFKILSWPIPDQVETAIDTLFGYLAYANNLLPVDTLADAFIYYLGFITVWYGLKITLKGFSVVPFIGRTFKFPTISHKIGKN